jgi:hypothetical protein
MKLNCKIIPVPDHGSHQGCLSTGRGSFSVKVKDCNAYLQSFMWFISSDLFCCVVLIMMSLPEHFDEM